MSESVSEKVSAGRDSSDRDASRPGLFGLFRQIPELITRLIRDEVAAAKNELASKLKAAAVGAGLLVAGIVIALLALTTLVATAVLGLSQLLAPWLSALIIGVALLVIAAVIVLIGVNKLKKGVPPVPKKTLASVKKDIGVVKGERA
jgi:hypothetical protein